MSIRTAVSDHRPSWHHPRIVSLLLLVFLCGAAAGALMVRLVHVQAAPASISTWNAGNREMSLEWFRKELAVTDDQAREIETVIDDYVMYYQNLQGQMDDFRAEGYKSIMKVLTPEQREKFEKMRGQFSGKLR